jgi:hypothetical protein
MTNPCGYVRVSTREQNEDRPFIAMRAFGVAERGYEEILAQWRVITREKQAAIVVLDMPIPVGDLDELAGTVVDRELPHAQTQ